MNAGFSVHKSLPLSNIETKIRFVVGVSWDEGEGVRLVYDKSPRSFLLESTDACTWDHSG